ncbi:MAG TPA: SatD family protein [Cellulomonas sp.]
MTIDQEGSRRVGDRVEALLAELARRGAPGLVRPFERTVGDEVQAVLDDPAVAVTIALDVLASGGWTVGLGAGPVDLPLPPTSRAGSGAAFVHAREAVEAAKRRHRPTAVPVAVRGDRSDLAQEAEAVLVLLGAIAARRSRAGREVVDLLRSVEPAPSQQTLAAELGISQQAVSDRLGRALWVEEVAARPAAARLLRLAAGPQDEGERG